MPKWTPEQQDAIYKKGTNIIVSAGAGSGKTAVLSERVLTHLKNGIQIDNLLILTFTNAAAAEMKERIRKKIKNTEGLEKQLDKIDTAPITTFDAYALSLVKKYSHLLNISPNISIADASVMDLKKKEIIEAIFNEYYEKEDPQFLKFIDDFTLKDDTKIKTSILKLNSQLDNLYDKEEVLNNYNDIFFTNDKKNSFLNEYITLILNKIEMIKTQIHNLSIYMDGDYINKLYDLLTPLLNSKNYTDIKNNNPIKLPPVPRGTEDDAKNIKNEISNLLKEIDKMTIYENENEILESLDKTEDYINIIIKIIKDLDKKVNKYKSKENVYEFIDIARIAINLLKNQPIALETLKNKYDEILIDEYQDTNDIQELFISLIEKNNVYMVGDIKQSIYRFRNTNPLLFKTKYENYSKENGGIKIDLNKNFRSRSDVLDGINHMFNLIMDPEIGGADYIDSHQMIFGNTSYNDVNKENYDLQILNYESLEDKSFSDDEIEIFTIAKDIQDKIESKYEIMDPETFTARPIEYSDFAILMDRSSQFEKYKKVFEYLNIPLTIYRDKAITSSLELTLLKNIYNLIINVKKIDTNFKFSFVSILRSYLYQIDDNEILKILKDGKIKETDLYQKCLRLSKNIEEKNNESLMYEIIDEFNFYEKIITIGNINQRYTVLDAITKIAQNCDSLGYTPEDFYLYLIDVFENGLDIKLSLNKDSSNSVKIMTIHASKGLEFPICYYSGLYKKFNIDDLKNLFYFSKDYGFIVPYFDDGLKSTILKTLLKNNYIHEEISERLRLFYVALTRAREKMIIISSIKPNESSYKENGVIASSIREKYISFTSILNSINEFIKQNINQIDIETINLTKEYNLSKNKILTPPNITKKININDLNIESNTVEKSHFSKTIHSIQTKENKQNIEMGLKMHSIFENIDFLNPNYETLTDFEKNKIKAFINTNILNNAKEIFKEYEFIYEDENESHHGIIDLLINKENENIIVDYKLKNIKDEEYINQLNGYKKYIEYITEKPTNIYLYSILDEKLEKVTI